MSSHFQPKVSDGYSTEKFSKCSELLPTTISFQYSDGSCFSSNSNKIFGAIVFSVQIASLRFLPGIPFEISHDSNLICQACYFKVS